MHFPAGEQENIYHFILVLDVTINIHFTVIMRNQIKTQSSSSKESITPEYN